jgi:hypothetical protein
MDDGLDAPGGFAFVATVVLVYLDALKREMPQGKSIEVVFKTYNGKAKGEKVLYDHSLCDYKETAEKLLKCEEQGKATILLIGLIRLMRVSEENVKLRLGLGTDAVSPNFEHASGQSVQGFLCIVPIRNPEVDNVKPGLDLGRPAGISSVGLDKVHEIYSPCMGMALPGNLNPQTVKVEETIGNSSFKYYDKEIETLGAKDPVIATVAHRITRLMSYSPTLLAAGRAITAAHSADRLHPATFTCPFVPNLGGAVSEPQKAMTNLEGVASGISQVHHAITSNIPALP